MGCAQVTLRLRPPRIQVDLGNLPSSEDDFTPLSTPSPKPPPPPPPEVISTVNKEAGFLKFKTNAMRCYFCNSNAGLLIRMVTCDCMFFGHEKCYRRWIQLNHFKCTICMQPYHQSCKSSLYLRKAMSLDTLEISKLTAVKRYKVMFLLNTQHEYICDRQITKDPYLNTTDDEMSQAEDYL